MNINSIKLVTLSNDWGYEDPLDMLEFMGPSEIIPAICMNKYCDYSIELEPDATKGWCEYCKTRTVTSALVLAGMI